VAEKIMISYYNDTIDKKNKDTGLDDFLDGIKSGKWQDAVLKIRTIADKKERTEAKKLCPLVTVSGSFTDRKDASLRKHSGFIAIDLDSIENPNIVKELLATDKYIYASFISISGAGLCLLFRIDGTKHTESFEGICAYLYETYQLIVDRASSNVGRARFISYDPYLVYSPSALLFKKYPAKKKKNKENRVVFVQSDFDDIITQMYNRNVNFCEDYGSWVSCAYSLISEFNDNALPYFHTLSSISGKYNSEDTDKQFEVCLKHHKEGKAKTASIGSIYYHAKQSGIDTYSAKTKEIIRATISQSKAGSSPEDVAIYLQKFQSIAVCDSQSIINQVIEKQIEFHSENIIEDIQSYLQIYGLRKNTITRNIEKLGKTLDDSDINSIFIDLKSINDKITKDLVCSVVFSNRIEQYNPFKEFLASYTGEPITQTNNLALLLHAIKSDTTDYDKWVTKWLVGIIASAFGNYSPLTLVLAGEIQGSGKTHFFRYLLPKQLRNLYAESDMDDGKDDEILMTKKLIILDDEYGGKSKKEFSKQKKITSKEWVNVREPYGRVSVDLRRLAMFGGTSNDLQIIYDPTGNRRVVPIHIIDQIDRKFYNECDKEMLFHELYALYKGGYDYTILGNEIKCLNDNTDYFKQSSHEEELIATKLSPGSSNIGEWMNITAIIQYLIADTKITGMSNTRVGMILSSIKYEKKRMRVGGTVVTAFFVNRVSETTVQQF
jgi:predicted P-loop ATPase